MSDKRISAGKSDDGRLAPNPGQSSFRAAAPRQALAAGSDFRQLVGRSPAGAEAARRGFENRLGPGLGNENEPLSPPLSGFLEGARRAKAPAFDTDPKLGCVPQDYLNPNLLKPRDLDPAGEARELCERFTDEAALACAGPSSVELLEPSLRFLASEKVVAASSLPVSFELAAAQLIKSLRVGRAGTRSLVRLELESGQAAPLEVELESNPSGLQISLSAGPQQAALVERLRSHCQRRGVNLEVNWSTAER